MYINFGYKLAPAQIQQMSAQLPACATTDSYDIEGRVQGDPGKDGMRALVLSLLTERFKLAVHEETKDMPVAALVRIQQGKFGPMIQPHPAGTPCPNDIAPGGVTPDGRFPVLCGGRSISASSSRGANLPTIRNISRSRRRSRSSLP